MKYQSKASDPECHSPIQNYDLPTGAQRALTVAFGTHAATLKVHAFHRPRLLISAAPVWALFVRRRS